AREKAPLHPSPYSRTSTKWCDEHEHGYTPTRLATDAALTGVEHADANPPMPTHPHGPLLSMRSRVDEEWALLAFVRRIRNAAMLYLGQHYGAPNRGETVTGDQPARLSHHVSHRVPNRQLSGMAGPCNIVS